jgi:hypothetical protein
MVYDMGHFCRLLELPSYNLAPPERLWKPILPEVLKFYPSDYVALVSLMGEGSLDTGVYCAGPLSLLPQWWDGDRDSVWPLGGRSPYPVAKDREGMGGMVPWGFHEGLALWWAPPSITGNAGEVWGREDYDWDQFGNSILEYLLTRGLESRDGKTSYRDRRHCWVNSDQAEAVALVAGALANEPPERWQAVLSECWVSSTSIEDRTWRYGSLYARQEGAGFSIVEDRDILSVFRDTELPSWAREWVRGRCSALPVYLDTMTSVLGVPGTVNLALEEGFAMWVTEFARIVLDMKEIGATHRSVELVITARRRL